MIEEIDATPAANLLPSLILPLAIVFVGVASETGPQSLCRPTRVRL
jgi:hypothetical protein